VYIIVITIITTTVCGVNVVSEMQTVSVTREITPKDNVCVCSRDDAGKFRGTCLCTTMPGNPATTAGGL